MGSKVPGGTLPRERPAGGSLRPDLVPVPRLSRLVLRPLTRSA